MRLGVVKFKGGVRHFLRRAVRIRIVIDRINPRNHSARDDIFTPLPEHPGIVA